MLSSKAITGINLIPGNLKAKDNLESSKSSEKLWDEVLEIFAVASLLAVDQKIRVGTQAVTRYRHNAVRFKRSIAPR